MNLLNVVQFISRILWSEFDYNWCLVIYVGVHRWWVKIGLVRYLF